MEVMYLLIAFSLLIASGFLLAFMWAVRSGQYDDRYTPSVRILIDDIRPEKKDADAATSRSDAKVLDCHSEQQNASGTRVGSTEPAGINKSNQDDAAGKRSDNVDSDDHDEIRDISEIRDVGAEQAGINKISNDKENLKNRSTGPIDGSRKSTSNSKRGSNQRSGKPAAGIRPQEHHLKPKTRR